MPCPRRRVLAAVASLPAVGAAGCLASDPKVTPRFGGLYVLNYDPEPDTVHLVVLEDERPIYWASERATAAPAEDDSGGAVFEGYPTDPGEYVLHARLDRQSRDEWVTIDFAEFDAECLTVSLEIGTFGSSDGRGDLSLWRSTTPFECDDSTPTPGEAA